MQSSIKALIVAAALSVAIPAQAGPFADDMAKCLVKSTSTEDKGLLVRWIFSIASIHPELNSVVSISGEQRERLNKDIAGLLERLILENCANETKAAIRLEGQSTIEQAFGVLGEAAMMELFANADVNAATGGFAKYLDEAKFAKVFE